GARLLARLRGPAASGPFRRPRHAPVGVAAGLAPRTAAVRSGGSAIRSALPVSACSDVERNRGGLGDAAAAAGRRLEGRVATQDGEELVDAFVIDAIDLELVAPRLKRDRCIEPWKRA